MPQAQKIIFSVTPREIEGSGVKKLRRQNILPVNVFGLSSASESAQVDRTKFDKLYAEEGDTGLIYLQIGESKRQVPVLIDDVQYHSITGATIHAAFKRVDLTEKVNAMVQIEVVGEFDVDGANLVTTMSEIEVEALPADLPDHFEVDVSTLTEIGQSITVADLKFDTETISLVLGEDADPTEMPVVIVQEVKEEVEEAPEPVEGEEDAQAEGEGEAGETSESSESSDESAE